MLPIPSKLVFVILGIVLIGSLVGGAFWYVKDMQDQIKILTASNQSLEIAVQTEKDKNVQLHQIMKDAQRETSDWIKQTRDSESRVAALEKKLEDAGYQERQRAVRESRKSSLYLRQINSTMKCVQDHFDDFTGECNAGGQFREKEQSK